jgi:hypothetical protein
MGLEAYRDVFIALGPITAADLSRTLTDTGFFQVDPLKDARPDCTYFQLRTCEAMMDARATTVQNSAETGVHSLSLRFAVCQPQSAIDQYISIADSLLNRYDFGILRPNNGVAFGPALSDFHVWVRADVEMMKARWAALFEGDAESILIPASEAWGYFLKKHPDVIKRPAHR